MNAALYLLLFKGGATTEVVATASYYPGIEGPPNTYIVLHGCRLISIIEGPRTTYPILRG